MKAVARRPQSRKKGNGGEKRRAGEWTEEEDRVLTQFQLQPDMRNQWTAISRLIPGRSEAAVKSHWNGVLRRRVDSDAAAAVTPGLAPPAMPWAAASARSHRTAKPRLQLPGMFHLSSSATSGSISGNRNAPSQDTSRLHLGQEPLQGTQPVPTYMSGVSSPIAGASNGRSARKSRAFRSPSPQPLAMLSGSPGSPQSKPQAFYRSSKRAKLALMASQSGRPNASTSPIKPLTAVKREATSVLTAQPYKHVRPQSAHDRRQTAAAAATTILNCQMRNISYFTTTESCGTRKRPGAFVDFGMGGAQTTNHDDDANAEDGLPATPSLPIVKDLCGSAGCIDDVTRQALCELGYSSPQGQLLRPLSRDGGGSDGVARPPTRLRALSWSNASADRTLNSTPPVQPPTPVTPESHPTLVDLLALSTPLVVSRNGCRVPLQPPSQLAGFGGGGIGSVLEKKPLLSMPLNTALKGAAADLNSRRSDWNVHLQSALRAPPADILLATQYHQHIANQLSPHSSVDILGRIDSEAHPPHVYTAIASLQQAAKGGVQRPSVDLSLSPEDNHARQLPTISLHQSCPDITEPLSQTPNKLEHAPFSEGSHGLTASGPSGRVNPTTPAALRGRHAALGRPSEASPMTREMLMRLLNYAHQMVPVSGIVPSDLADVVPPSLILSLAEGASSIGCRGDARANCGMDPPESNRPLIAEATPNQATTLTVSTERRHSTAHSSATHGHFTASAVKAAAAMEAESEAWRPSRMSEQWHRRPSLGGPGTASSGSGCLAGLLAWPSREVMGYDPTHILKPRAKSVAGPSTTPVSQWRMPLLLPTVRPTDDGGDDDISIELGFGVHTVAPCSSNLGFSQDKSPAATRSKAEVSGGAGACGGGKPPCSTALAMLHSTRSQAPASASHEAGSMCAAASDDSCKSEDPLLLMRETAKAHASLYAAAHALLALPPPMPMTRLSTSSCVSGQMPAWSPPSPATSLCNIQGNSSARPSTTVFCSTLSVQGTSVEQQSRCSTDGRVIQLMRSPTSALSKHTERNGGVWQRSGDSGYVEFDTLSPDTAAHSGTIRSTNGQATPRATLVVDELFSPSRFLT